MSICWGRKQNAENICAARTKNRWPNKLVVAVCASVAAAILCTIVQQQQRHLFRRMCGRSMVRLPAPRGDRLNMKGGLKRATSEH